jgi:hypothetical protein
MTKMATSTSTSVSPERRDIGVSSQVKPYPL